MDVPQPSIDRLRTLSRTDEYSSNIRIRSSPSSPNRLSKSPHLQQIHLKWRTDLESKHILKMSKIVKCDRFTDCSRDNQLELPEGCTTNTMSVPISTYGSCQSLQLKDDMSFDNLYGTVERRKSSGLSSLDCAETSSIDENIPACSQCSCQKENSVFNKISLTNPINFKKALRDRYLSSQLSSNLNKSKSFVSASSQNPIEAFFGISTDMNNELNMFETKDSTYITYKEIDSQIGAEPTESCESTCNHIHYKNSLSLDILSPTIVQKCRFPSKTVSGIETEGDPFSPTSSGICSPFLRLNLPYRVSSSWTSESMTPNLISSSSISPQASTTADSLEKISDSQKFFPDTMKLSDFFLSQNNKGDATQYLTPDFVANISNSRSSSQSAHNVSVCHTAASPLSTLSRSMHSDVAHVSRQTSELSTHNFGRLSNSKSMDHIHKCLRRKNKSPVSKTINDEIGRDSIQSLQSDKTECSLSQDSSISNCINIIKSSSYSHLLSGVKKKSVSLSPNPRQCSICGRQFSRSDMLARHVRVHTGHKPFECSICSQSFSRSDHLNTHMRIHSGEKPYQCSLCSYSACRRDMITRHLRVHKRKGDILSNSTSTLIVNTRISKSFPNKKFKTLFRSEANLNNPVVSSSEKENVNAISKDNSNQSRHLIAEALESVGQGGNGSKQLLPKSFVNIAISICQPTPRSSFSLPMETQTE